MQDEQTNKAVPQGATTDKVTTKGEEPVSEYDKALALVKRREEVTKVELEVLAKKEKIATNEMLGGTSGGHIETKPNFTDEEKASRARIKAVADVNNSAWGKKYE